MYVTKMQKSFWIIFVIVSILAMQTSPFSKTSNIAFSQVKIGIDAKQTDKFSGAQESTLKITNSSPGFVKGKIFDNVTGVGIPDVNVTLKQFDITVTSDKTADDGTFFIQILPGNYSVSAVKNGFAENNSDIKVSAFETVIKNINMAPTISFPSIAPPAEEPPISKCKRGGSPSGIEVFPTSLTVRPGSTKRVRVHVLKDKRAGCSIDVNINCISGCNLIALASDTITTNRRGFAISAIKTKGRQEGVAVIMFSVEDLEFLLPVVIDNDRRSN